jgi:hypothetical protein
MATKAKAVAADGQLARRVRALEARIEELTAAPVSEVVRSAREGIGLQAWPPDLADGQVLTAAHVNAIRNGLFFWQGEVNANSNALINLSRIDLNMGGVAGADLTIAMNLNRAWDAIGDAAMIRASGGVGDMGFFIPAGAMGGFIMSLQAAGETDYSSQVLRMHGDGYFSLPKLRSTNPGGGKQLWYDPADGNRVKFAP